MANIHDVARVAGVSISTVSYALSGKRSIAESTRQRIADAVRELNYRPNAGARMLAGSRSHIFALTAPLRADTYVPAHMAFVLAVATAARRYDYDVLLLTEDEATHGLERVASSRLVDGIIVLDVSIEDERIELIRGLDIPSTLVGVPGDVEGLVCVDLDFEAAADLAVERLAEKGHRSIGLLGQPEAVYDRGSNFPTRFRDAFTVSAAARGASVSFAMPETDAKGVRRALDQLYAQEPGLTALVMNCEESIQVTALEILRDRGIRVPEDLSIVSACSSFDTSHFTPAIDVIPLSATESCSRAVELAIEQVSGRVEPRVELIPPRYVELGSTASIN